MQLNISTDYAIRIVYYLALKGDTATSSEISGQMGIPQSVTAAHPSAAAWRRTRRTIRRGPLHLEKLVEHRSAPYHGPRESGSGAGRPSAGPPLPREGG